MGCRIGDMLILVVKWGTYVYWPAGLTHCTEVFRRRLCFLAHFAKLWPSAHPLLKQSFGTISEERNLKV